MSLPLVGVVFGYVAYLLFEVGLVSIGQTSSSSSSTNPLFFPAIVAFLAGYSTDWIKKILDGLASGTGSGSSSKKTSS